jgi:aminomethyltransferase
VSDPTDPATDPTQAPADGPGNGEPLRQTCLHDLHLANGGRMVPFAGYEMPVRYGPGPVAEHQQCRTSAALFDVSHMGIVEVSGPDAAAKLETLVPAAVTTLANGSMKYSFLTNADGGIVDDLMITAGPELITLVVNAACKEDDLVHLRLGLPDDIRITYREDLALLALQGPAAVAAVARHAPAVADLTFMQAATATVAGIPVAVSRSGYTGEDGLEITVEAARATELAEVLLGEPEVALAGLAARDSLRLEAGLCLYGHDLDPTTTPVEAGLTWAIPPRRRRDGGFVGAAPIQRHLAEGPPRRRVGLQPIGRKPVRDGAVLHAEGSADPVGVVTSGGFGPTVGAPVAMGYVASGHHELDTEIEADVRGTRVACRVTALPFVPHRYHRAGAPA